MAFASRICHDSRARAAQGARLAATPLLRLKGTGCGASCVASRARSLRRSPTRPSCPCWPLPQVSTPPARVNATQWSAPATGIAPRAVQPQLSDQRELNASTCEERSM